MYLQRHKLKGGVKPTYSSDDDVQATVILLAMGLEQYAQLLIGLKKFEVARKYLQEALELCRSVNGENHIQTAILKNGIGKLA